ncbi:MAG: PhoH family protein [Firmicutes bacterium]|nr:PhoH family protein [Bacillota bacterium]
MAEGREVEERLIVADNAEALALFGQQDVHLRLVEENLGVRLIPRGNEVVVVGLAPDVAKVTGLFRQSLELLRSGNPLSEKEFRYALRLARAGEQVNLGELFSDVITVTVRGKPIKPKTVGQKEYADAIRTSGVTFGIGPAGTGKTYLAMAMAVTAFKNHEVNRIVLTRPAVEAGEKLGFLPGDLQEKVNPYLRPLHDALFDILGMETSERYAEKGLIEVAPLAYMRGRTLDDAFIILDEAQNTTPEQMKMFLTRLGFGSKAVVTGDITQVDLPHGTRSGLDDVRRVLQGVEGVSFVYLTDRDVVRQELVAHIIQAYDRQAREGEEGNH